MIYLIDLANFVYRYSATLNRVKSINGVSYDVSPLFAISKLFSSRIADLYGLVLDGTPLMSSITNAHYKSNRNHEVSETLRFSLYDITSVAFAVAKSLKKDLRLFYHLGQEADQVVSSLVHIAANEFDRSKDLLYECSYDNRLRWLDKFQTQSIQTTEFISKDIILESSDSDFNQLLVYDKFYIASVNGIVNNRTNRAVGFVEPFQVPLYKAILGDKSDSVFGCKFKGYTNPQVLDLIKSTSKEDVDDIIQNVCMSTHKLASLIRDTCLRQFLSNLSVVQLRYFGTPMQAISTPASVVHGNKLIKKFLS